MDVDSAELRTTRSDSAHDIAKAKPGRRVKRDTDRA